MLKKPRGAGRRDSLPHEPEGGDAKAQKNALKGKKILTERALPRHCLIAWRHRWRRKSRPGAALFLEAVFGVCFMARDMKKPIMAKAPLIGAAALTCLLGGMGGIAVIGGCAALRLVHPAPQDAAQAAYEAKYLGRQIRDLSFFPLNGERFRLSELQENKAIVFVMREKDCPISEKYGLRLKKLEAEYIGVHFIYLYVGGLKPQESAAADLKKFGFQSPYSLDLKQDAINALGAETSGDVFILTAQDRRIVYKGPLDDQYHLLRGAPAPKNRYVQDVLRAIVKGRQPKGMAMPAPGCVISRPI